MMLQYSIYSVISPEGCASILFKDAARAPEAAEAMRITANDLYGHKLVDEIVPEPLGGAHRDMEATMVTVRQKLTDNLERLRHTPMTKLLADRYTRLLASGPYETLHRSAASRVGTVRGGKCSYRRWREHYKKKK